MLDFDRTIPIRVRILLLVDMRIPGSQTSQNTSPLAAVERLRMQFWRDALAATFSEWPPAEPVAILLHKVVTDGKAPLSKS
jgi:hypothetical protein